MFVKLKFRPEAELAAGSRHAVRHRLRNQLQFAADHRGSRDQLHLQTAGDPHDLVPQTAQEFRERGNSSSSSSSSDGSILTIFYLKNRLINELISCQFNLALMLIELNQFWFNFQFWSLGALLRRPPAAGLRQRRPRRGLPAGAAQRTAGCGRPSPPARERLAARERRLHLPGSFAIAGRGGQRRSVRHLLRRRWNYVREGPQKRNQQKKSPQVGKQ